MTLAERAAAIDTKAREIAASVSGFEQAAIDRAARALVDFPNAPQHGLGDICSIADWENRKVAYAAVSVIAAFKAAQAQKAAA